MNKTDIDVNNPLALAADREAACDDLDTMIKEMGIAYRRYQHVTAALSDHVGPHLGRRMEVPLALALRAAGFSSFLARQLEGPAVSLRSIAETDHQGFARQA